MEKYCRAGQATDDNTAHAHCMLDNSGYKYTHTHTKYIKLIAFALQHWLQEPPQCYVITTMPVLLMCKIFLRCYYVHTRHWRGEYVSVMGVYTNVQYAVTEHCKCSKAHTSICAV